MRRNKISKGIILTIYCISVFLISLILLSALMNRGNTDMTAELSHATFPVVSFSYEGQPINELHGYAKEMDIPYFRDSLTPLMEGRKVSIKIDTFGTGISQISYEVRTIDTKRLLENTIVYNYVQNQNVITADLSLKDLMEKGKEYSLCIILNTDSGQTIRYYTRIFQDSELAINDKIEYVYHFNAITFDKYAASVELPTYLESNSEGDNTTFQYVNIHSSLEQVTWGELNVVPVTQPVVTIKDLYRDIACLGLRYYVAITQDDQTVYYAVEEHYRVRTGEERIYLLDYERTMNQIFQLESATINHNKIVIGIAEEDFPMEESSDGNRLAFVNRGQLYTYNVTDNKIALVYGFYDKVLDIREFYGEHDIKIFSIDETGNIQFMVYGYMNRGIHEGEMGVAVYYYNSVLNTVEEQAFVPYDKNFALLKQDLEQLAYVNGSNEFYFHLGDSLYRVDLEEHCIEPLVTQLVEGAFAASDNHSIVAWVSGGDINNATQIVMLDLSGGARSIVEAAENARIRPIGFFGEDFIYGMAKKEDIFYDATEKILYPMYQLTIRDIQGNILKQYEEPGYYVVETIENENMITLERMIQQDNGTWEQTTNDQILYNSSENAGRNTVETVITENYETMVQIVVKKEIDTQTMQILQPRIVIYEDNRMVSVPEEIFRPHFYTYHDGVFYGTYDAMPLAVMDVVENGGFVTDDYGNCLYRKMSRRNRNQIMAIEAVKSGEGENESLAVCLDIMVSLYGFTIDSLSMLEEGMTPEAILASTSEKAMVLDLNGCSLDSVLYYVAKDIPVLARLADGNAVLVIGYNENQIVIMNPETGTIYKIGMNEAVRWFRESGNWFMVYTM